VDTVSETGEQQVHVLQRVAIGFPGGIKGREDASTTPKPFTPKTLALLSTTAFGYETFPIDAVQQP
jgi:hypothetical protein